MGRQSTGKVDTPPFSINPRWHCFHRGGPFSSSLQFNLGGQLRWEINDKYRHLIQSLN